MFLGPTRVPIPNGISIGSAVFAQLTAWQRVSVLYLPLKIASAIGGIGAPYFWAHPSPRPKPYLDRFSRFCRAHDCDRQTHRRTDRPCYSVCNNRPHLTSAAMRPDDLIARKSQIPLH